MIRRAIARFLSAEVRRLERELDDERAARRLAERERDDLEREVRAVQERHRADVEAYALDMAARHGGVGMCWGGSVSDA